MINFQQFSQVKAIFSIMAFSVLVSACQPMGEIDERLEPSDDVVPPADEIDTNKPIDDGSLAGASGAQPLFETSVVGTDYDFITAGDPSAFKSLTFVKRGEAEMPDKRPNIQLMDAQSFIFKAQFTDNTEVTIQVHSDFNEQKIAQEFANKITGPLGKLPNLMRAKLSHVNILKGDETAFGEDQGHFFVLYSENMNKRIGTHDLEETVFHESVHATLDYKYAADNEWQLAQQADGVSITEYGAGKLGQEDLAETALFAYTMIMHPGRLPADVESWVQNYIPNRWQFLKTVVFKGL